MPEVAALITVLIMERPMCVECIANRAQISEAGVRGYLDRIDKMVTVTRARNERCRTCGRIGDAFSVSRAAQ